MTLRHPALGSALFFVAGPGLEVGVGPYVITRWERGGGILDVLVLTALGAFLVLGGVAALVEAHVRFAREGSGTPSPLAPPTGIVASGLYRRVRNPMYLAAATAIAGQGLLLARPILLACAVLYLGAMALLVRRFEEPLLRRRFGSEYDAYRAAVPGWWPARRQASERSPSSPSRISSSPNSNSTS